MPGAYNRGVSTDPSGLPPDLPPDILGKIPLFAELQKVLSWSGGPVNWDLARQVAVAAVAAQPGGPPAGEAAEDARIANLWIAGATGLTEPGVDVPIKSMSPAEWAEHACVAYREMIDPLAAKVSSAIAEQAGGAMADAMPGELPPGMDGGAIGQALSQMAPLFLGVQVGGVLGSVAKDVLGSRDLPIPPADGGPLSIVPATVARFAQEYAIDSRDAMMWAVLHESAHRVIEESLPTYRSSFFALFHDYVASLSIDFSGALERLQGLDFTDPAGVEAQMGGQGFFDVLDSPASTAAAARLEHLIAVTEAFADQIVAAAADGRLPAAGRVAEAAARHRSAGDGPAALQRFIAVGASEDARRTAGRFVRAVADAGGWDALKHMWEDSETMPTPTEVTDPNAWLERIR